VTIRRYLNYLIEIQEMVSSIDYETGGRPRVLYLLKR
jgi:response regulator of citrate/malate metabolism